MKIRPIYRYSIRTEHFQLEVAKMVTSNTCLLTIQVQPRLL